MVLQLHLIWLILMPSKDFFLVETPLQLMCAHEAISETQREYSLFLRMSGVGRNDQQLCSMADGFGLNYKSKLIRPEKIVIDSLRALPVLLPYIFNSYARIFIGSYFSRFLMLFSKTLRCQEVWLLDDGVATFLAQKRMHVSGKVNNLYTYFNVKPLRNQKIVRHCFEKLVCKYSVNGATLAGNIFVGQTLVERGFLPLPKYLDVVRGIAKNNSPLLYIPHRAESEETIEAVGLIDGVSILKTDTNIEFFLLTKFGCPVSIYSFFSSALFSLSAFFPGAKLYSLESDLVDQSKAEHFSDVIQALTELKNLSFIKV